MILSFDVITLVLTLFSGFTGTYAALIGNSDKGPAPITRTVKANSIITTEILRDKTTSREDLIHACKFLADEGVQLTFESLNIRRSFLGVLGKKRISQAKGKVELPNSSNEAFEAGDAISFHSIKITYTQNTTTNTFAINMVEIEGGRSRVRR
ncbi:MAG: hypothetical protein WBA23_17355 [Tunicatimonas sp.]|uniref:hypothetical protein n=1 Tax=Tunicatimonas sp. TaxID=1940096 RepID=UPI003C790ED2